MPAAAHIAAKGGMNARWITLRCKEPAFWEFLSQSFSEIVQSETQALNVVKHYVGAESRKEFDNEPGATERFALMIRRPHAHFIAIPTKAAA
jgi:hypothetical protein